MQYIRKYYDARDGTVKYDYRYVHHSGKEFCCNGVSSVEDARRKVRQQGYDWFCNLVPVRR